MRQRGELVAQLEGGLRAALEEWARSLSVEELSMLTGLGDHEVKVDSDSILVFDPERPQNDIELSRLRRMLKNISNHSHDVYKYLTALAGDEDDEPTAPEGRSYTLAARKLLTMRDSSMEMSKLLNGEDLDEGEEPDEPLLGFTVDSLTDEDKERLHEVAALMPSDPFAEVDDPLLALAQVHRQIRDALKDVPAAHCTIDGALLHQRFNKITGYVRDFSGGR